MAIINVNGISGINSITAQSGSLNFYTAAGNNLPISAATLNVGTGASVSSPATNVLTLGTNNVEAVRISSSGNTGIGTNNPTTKLEIVGETTPVKVTHTGGDGLQVIRQSKTLGLNANYSNLDTHCLITASSGMSLAFATNGDNERFRITSTGQLQATGAADVRLTLGSGGTAGTNDSVHIRADGANLKFMNASGGVTIFEQNGTERVRIDSSGRVTKPYTPHIFGSIGNNSTQNNSFASYMNVFSSTELTFSNSRITVPVAGVYMITFTTISDNVTARKDANIYINGTSRLAMLTDTSSTGYKYRSGSMSVKLSANDYIQFFNETWYDYTSTGYIDWRTASVTFLG